MKLYLGIDTSSTNTALVLLNGSNGDLLEFVLFSPKQKDILERTTEICKLVDSFLVRNTPLFDLHELEVSIEGASFNSRGRRDKLIMLAGFVYHRMRTLGYKVNIVAPTSIKKKFTGNGRAQKEEVIAFVPKSIIEEFKVFYRKLDDLADAYALASITRRGLL